MSRKNLFALATALLAAAALGIAGQAVRATRERTALLSSLLTRRARLAGEIANAEKRMSTAGHALESLKSKPAAVKKSPAVPPGSKPMLSEDAALRNDPRLQTLYLNYQRAQVRNNLAPYWRALGLTSEQARKMEEIRLQAEERSLDLKWAAQAQGTPLNNPAYRSLQQQVTAQSDGEVQNLLGEAGARQFQELARAMPVNHVVGEMGAAMAQTGVPLSSDQAAQLTQLFASSSTDYQAGKAALLTSIDWDVTLPQARAIVSAPQQATLEATIAKYRESQALSALRKMAAQSR